VGFIATVAVKGLGVEVALAISGDVDVLEPTGGGDEIAGVAAVAIPLAFRVMLSPSGSDKCL
jgi:hypothetical protein